MSPLLREEGALGNIKRFRDKQKGQEWRKSLKPKDPIKKEVDNLDVLLKNAEIFIENGGVSSGQPPSELLKKPANLLLSIAFTALREKFAEKAWLGDEKKRNLLLSVLNQYKNIYISIKKGKRWKIFDSNEPAQRLRDAYLSKALDEMSILVNRIDKPEKLEETYRLFVSLVQRISKENTPQDPLKVGGTDYRKKIAVEAKKLYDIFRKRAFSGTAVPAEAVQVRTNILRLIIKGHEAAQIDSGRARNLASEARGLSTGGAKAHFKKILEILEINFAKN